MNINFRTVLLSAILAKLKVSLKCDNFIAIRLFLSHKWKNKIVFVENSTQIPNNSVIDLNLHKGREKERVVYSHFY